jgi:hypothetical protein
MAFEQRIDAHAHFLPPFYRQACIDANFTQPDGMPKLPVFLCRAIESYCNVLIHPRNGI